MAIIGGNYDFVRGLISQQGQEAERRARAQINATASRGSTNPTAIADARSRALAHQRAALAERNTAALTQARQRDQDQERQALAKGINMVSGLLAMGLSAGAGGGGAGSAAGAAQAGAQLAQGIGEAVSQPSPEQTFTAPALQQRSDMQSRFAAPTQQALGQAGSALSQAQGQGQRNQPGEPDGMDPLGPISTVLGSFMPMFGGMAMG